MNTSAKNLILTIGAIFTVGCDPHVDSVYLGRAESNFLSDVGKGDVKAVKAYLDNGGNVNLQDEPGMTPLHHAVNGNWNGANYGSYEFQWVKNLGTTMIKEIQITCGSITLAKYSGEYKSGPVFFLVFRLIVFGNFCTLFKGGFFKDGLIFETFSLGLATLLIGNWVHLLPHELHCTNLPLGPMALSGTTNFFSHELQLKIIIF